MSGIINRYQEFMRRPGVSPEERRKAAQGYEAGLKLVDFGSMDLVDQYEQKRVKDYTGFADVEVPDSDNKTFGELLEAEEEVRTAAGGHSLKAAFNKILEEDGAHKTRREE